MWKTFNGYIMIADHQSSNFDEINRTRRILKYPVYEKAYEHPEIQGIERVSVQKKCLQISFTIWASDD